MEKVTPNPSSSKKDNLTPEHLKWLVESRSANQHAALKLFSLFETYPERINGKMFSTTAQIMVAACFSLWRAAFLADKTGKRQAVVGDAKAFLGKMLTDNAITYAQDRSAREWTFNYYMNNAKAYLLRLPSDWKLEKIMLPRNSKKQKGETFSMTRWNRHQKAFEVALDFLADQLAQQQGK